MIGIIFNFILALIQRIITIAFTPINTIVQNYFPDLTSALNYITSFFNHLKQYSAFIMSYTGLSDVVIQIIVTLFIASILIPFAVHGIKLGLKWWEELV